MWDLDIYGPKVLSSVLYLIAMMKKVNCGEVAYDED